MADKIATENDVKTIDELKTFLKEHDHPIVKTWKEKPVSEAMAPEVARKIPDETPFATVSTLPISAGGYKIILKDAKIYAKKVIIRSTKGEKIGEKRT